MYSKDADILFTFHVCQIQSARYVRKASVVKLWNTPGKRSMRFSRSPPQASVQPRQTKRKTKQKMTKGLCSMSDTEIEKQANLLNSETASWPKYDPGNVANVHKSTQPEHIHLKISRDRNHRKENGSADQAEEAVAEFLKKCHGDKPTDLQIRHLLESDARLTGETLERLKRKLLRLMKMDKKKPSESPLRTTIPLPQWGEHFFHQDQRIEIVNSCPIDNLLTCFHLLFSSDSSFHAAFESLTHQGAKTLLSLHQMFKNLHWSVGKDMWLTQVNLGVDPTRHIVSVWGGEDERFSGALREVTIYHTSVKLQ